MLSILQNLAGKYHCSFAATMRPSSRPELLERLTIEAIGAVRLRAEPEHALVVFVNRKYPVVSAVFGDRVVRHRLPVVTPNDATENRHPHRTVVAQCARHEDIV